MPTYRYHWTPRANLSSIAATGLDPQFAGKRKRVVWTAGESRILWACQHVAHTHQVSHDDLVLLRIRVDGLDGTRTSWPDVLVYGKRIPASRISGVRLSALAGWTSIKAHRV